MLSYIFITQTADHGAKESGMVLALLQFIAVVLQTFPMIHHVFGY